MLLTFSGHSYVIDEKQYERILMAPAKSTIRLSGALVNTSAISEILSLDAYYLEHPDKRPMPVYEAPRFGYAPKSEFGPERRKKALESLLRGFNQAVTEQGYPISEKQEPIRARIVAAISSGGAGVPEIAELFTGKS